MIKQMQHGDVLLKSIDQLPQGIKLVERKNGSLVIMDGEASGHKHTVLEESAKLWEINGILYLDAIEPVTIHHEEHKPLAIPAGIYQIGQVQEYDYFKQKERSVQD